MAALTCDICGGRLKMSKGKIATCESCGMEHNIERVREKVQEIKGTIHTDSAHLIGNFLLMAKDAFTAHNFTDTEKYCNKIIEIDAKNHEAFILKGKALGWSSSLANNRLKETATCFANAVNSASDEEQKNKIFTSVEKEFKDIAVALIRLRIKNFIKWINQSTSIDFNSDISEIELAISLFEKSTELTIERNEVYKEIVINTKAYITNTYYNKILSEFEMYQSKSAYLQYIQNTDKCINILEKIIKLCDNDNELDIEVYNTIIDMLKEIINNNTTDLVCNYWGAYIETPRITQTEIEKRKNKIYDIESKIEKLKKTKS